MHIHEQTHTYIQICMCTYLLHNLNLLLRQLRILFWFKNKKVSGIHFQCKNIAVVEL